MLDYTTTIGIVNVSTTEAIEQLSKIIYILFHKHVFELADKAAKPQPKHLYHQKQVTN